MLKKILPCLFVLTAATAAFAESYRAVVDIDFENRTINGVISLKSEDDKSISFNLDGFNSVTVDENPFVIGTQNLELNLKKDEETRLYFKKELTQSDIISEDFISLNSIFPIITKGNMDNYVFSVTLPKGFEAVSAANEVKKVSKKDSTEFVFTISKPVQTFDLIGSKNYTVKTKKTGNTEVAVYFFKDDKDLAESYLSATVKYIEFYENLLQSEFPYNRFAVVEHIHPYGYAVPTYTVLGKSVVRLPFIISTSLGHETLHQWFGTAIDLKEGGNWFEAVTSFYSDLGNLSTDEEKAAYRKNSIVSYENYTSSGEAYPLNEFLRNDSKLSQSIGYGKGAMVLQTLRTMVGDDAFLKGIRAFVKEYKYKNASWQDIFNSFEGMDLKDFANYWLNSADIPSLKVSESMFTIEKGNPVASFVLTRQSGPEKMVIPYSVIYKDHTEKGLIDTVVGDNEISIQLKSPYATLIIDKDYEVMRSLTSLERPAALSAFYSKGEIIGVCDNDSEGCKMLFESLGVKDVKKSESLSLMDFAGKNIVICGIDNPIVKTFAAGLKKDKRVDSQYAVLKNPHTDGKYILVSDNPLAENIRLLTHYGKYASLKFVKGKNTEKTVYPSDMGIEVISKEQDKAYVPASAHTMQEIIQVAELYPAIFIGERHDKYAHHLNQLEIIKGLHKKGHKLAVGFEQVRKSFQPVLSAYINGEISEREFLKGIDYYGTWGFDYNLYAPIFRYLRDNKIVALGLNIDSEPVKKISSGNLDLLTAKDFEMLPKEMEIYNRDYAKSLSKIFDMHPVREGDKRTFGNFFLAQNVWDETMAETLASFHKENPSYKLVVIAGSGHLGKKSGIPLRFERLTGKSGFVISQDDFEYGSDSDIIIKTTEIFAHGTPKLGVVLETKDGKLVVESVDKNSPAFKSGIEKSDIILSCDSVETSTITDLRHTLFEKGYGNNIDCVIERKGTQINKKILLEPYEEDQKAMMEKMAEMMKKKKEEKKQP